MSQMHVLKLVPQTRNEILQLFKDVCSNSVKNKAFKNQRRHLSIVLLSKLQKEVKFGFQSKAPGEKFERKEVLNEKEKKEAEKNNRLRKSFASKTYGKETTDTAIDNLSSDKENWL
ncbi:hypothetical protein TNCV_3650521 [Trichonephila clavipes]|uniref:Uncharacterized protein n=1 Tax=Trichonephila clavipes TaxID=2585209 RepID=A0A8X6SA94_TRICX|nr:hypothetical protein TNCV_3650521 [Trichonephila clavipes]